MGSAIGWLHFAALIALGGAVAGRWLIATRARDRTGERLTEMAQRLGLGAGVGLFVAMALLFGRQLEEFRDPFVPWQEDAALLLSTDWGRMWILATIGSALLPPLFGAARGGGGMGRVGWIGATIVVGGVASFPAFAGHAAGTGALRWLSIPADVVHVLASGSWIGGLLLVLAAVQRERSRDGGGKGNGGDVLLAEAVPLFSPVALISAGLVVTTGTISSLLQVDSWALLFGSPYGRLLLTKIGLVLLVMTLGAINWRRLTPRIMQGSEGAGALRRNALGELIVAQIVIAATAILVQSSPDGY